MMSSTLAFPPSCFLGTVGCTLVSLLVIHCDDECFFKLSVLLRKLEDIKQNIF